MALYLDEGDPMLFHLDQEAFPQIHVLHRFFVLFEEAIPLPVDEPSLIDGIAEIGAVGIKGHLTGLVKGCLLYTSRCV